MENSISHRVKIIMDYKSLNYRRFGELLGYSDVSIAKIIQGKNKPKFEFLDAIIKKIPEINPAWLLTGKGPMLKTDIEPEQMERLNKLMKQTEELNKKVLFLNEQNALLKEKIQFYMEKIEFLTQKLDEITRKKDECEGIKKDSSRIVKRKNV